MSITLYYFLVLKGKHTIKDADGVQRCKPGDVIHARVNLVEALSDGAEHFELIGERTIDPPTNRAEPCQQKANSL